MATKLYVGNLSYERTDQDITILAQQVTASIAQTLPGLLNGASDGRTEKIETSLGEAAAEKLWPKIKDDPKAKAAADQVASEPSNPVATEVLSIYIRTILERDADLRKELTALLASHTGVMVTSSVYGDIGQTIVTSRELKDATRAKMPSVSKTVAERSFFDTVLKGMR
jgi:hypothetical protein